MAQTQTLAPSRPIITSLTTMSACRNRPQSDRSPAGRPEVCRIHCPIHCPSLHRPPRQRCPIHRSSATHRNASSASATRGGIRAGLCPPIRTQASLIRTSAHRCRSAPRIVWRSTTVAPPTSVVRVSTTSSVVEPRGAHIVHFDATHHEHQIVNRSPGPHAGFPRRARPRCGRVRQSADSWRGRPRRRHRCPRNRRGGTVVERIAIIWSCAHGRSWYATRGTGQVRQARSSCDAAAAQRYRTRPQHDRRRCMPAQP